MPWTTRTASGCCTARGRFPRSSAPTPRRRCCSSTRGQAAGELGRRRPGFDWPEREHGIFVDSKDFVWISGNGGWPKPTAPGQRRRHGPEVHDGRKAGDADWPAGTEQGQHRHRQRQQAADVFVDTRANEVYVADGYGGSAWWCSTPTTASSSGCGARSAICRRRGRAQSWRPQPEAGRRRTAVVQPGARGEGLDATAWSTSRTAPTTHPGVHDRRQIPASGAAGRLEQRDAGAGRVRVLPGSEAAVSLRRRFRTDADRDLRSRAAGGDWPRGHARAEAGEFDIVHHMATDSKGNLYGAEIVTNRRAQRFVLQK